MRYVTGTDPYAIDEAKRVVAGYAFGQTTRARRTVLGAVGDPPPNRPVSLFGYRTYDCIDPDPDPRLGVVDLLVPAALNARLNARASAGLQSVRESVSDVLETIEEERTARPEVAFWTLSEEEVAQPKDDNLGWLLNHAWSLLMWADGVGVALAHKILHHKMPRLFPLIDGETLVPLQGAALDRRRLENAWAQVHFALNHRPSLSASPSLRSSRFPRMSFTIGVNARKAFRDADHASIRKVPPPERTTIQRSISPIPPPIVRLSPTGPSCCSCSE